MQREIEIRRAAFGLIPQLPRGHEEAISVLDFALAIADIATTLGRDSRRLAADIAMLLPDDPDEARRTLIFARKQIEEQLTPSAVAEDLGVETPAMERLRLV